MKRNQAYGYELNIVKEVFRQRHKAKLSWKEINEFWESLQHIREPAKQKLSFLVVIYKHPIGHELKTALSDRFMKRNYSL